MHVEPKPLSSYPWFLRPFYWHQRRKYGEVLKPALLWGRTPWLFVAVASMVGVLDRRRSPLSPSLRSLVTVRVSQLNHCAFCVDINSATLHERGVSWEKIDALSGWSDSALYDEPERAALAYTDAITRTDGEVDAEMIARLKRSLSDDALVELTGLIAFQNLSSKFNAALDAPPQGFCRAPRASER